MYLPQQHLLMLKKSQYKKARLDPSKKAIYHSEFNFLYPFVQTIEDFEDDEVEFLMKKEPGNDEDRFRMRENFYERPMSSSSGRNSSRHLSYESRPSPSLARQSVMSVSGYSSTPVLGSSEAMQIDDTEDDLKPLFESWYRTTKKLRPVFQRYVKRQFSEIINVTEDNDARGIAE